LDSGMWGSLLERESIFWLICDGVEEEEDITRRGEWRVCQRREREGKEIGAEDEKFIVVCVLKFLELQLMRPARESVWSCRGSDVIACLGHLPFFWGNGTKVQHQDLATR
jgi:hypothetical protein